MPEHVQVENFGGVAHRYEHRATGVMYVWPVGETREVPEEVAHIVMRAHPQKLRYAQRMMDTRAPVGWKALHRHYWRQDGKCRCGAKREED